MDLDQYPRGLPEHLREQYDKYVQAPKRFKALYPVIFKLLLTYMEPQHGKESQSKRRTSK